MNELEQLRAENARLKEAQTTFDDCVEINQLRAERDAWKAAHDNQVNLRRILMDRPDLQDRAKRMTELLAELAASQQQVAALRDSLAAVTKERDVMREKNVFEARQYAELAKETITLRAELARAGTQNA